MTLHRPLAVAVAVALACATAAVAGDSRSARPVTVHLIGDSTMADKPLEGNPERGWGQMLTRFFAEGVLVANHAVNGRSTKSFIDEGRWTEVVSALVRGDYVVIQFGHNDEKQEDARRYAEAHTTYKSNLERFVGEARAKGATPVLCTPVIRRRFDDAGRFFDTHGDYPAVVREVARSLRVPLIDLHASTEKLLVERGVEGSKALYLWIAPGVYPTCPNGRQDDTHFSEDGATEVASLFVRGLRASRLPLGRRLRATPVAAPPPPKTAYLFSYFRGNGEDGLHLAYSRDALHWFPLRAERSFLAPAVGPGKLMRDPCILQGPDGVYRMVWTTGWWDKGIGYASSPDLVHWSEQRFLGVMEHEGEALNSWAPEIVFDDDKGQYVIFWATTIPDRFPETDHQSHEGPPKRGENHRIYAVTSRDLVTFGPTELFFDQGFNVIDATVVRDGDRYVMFVKDETAKPFPMQKNLRVSTAPHANGPWTPVSKPITGDYWAEGPTALKISNRWIVYFDKYRDHRYGAVVSADLEHWEDVSDHVSLPEGARHGTMFRVSEEVLTSLLALE